MDDTKLILCACHHPEHQFILEAADGEAPNDPGEVWMQIHLSKQPFLKRLAYAFKYTLGFQSKHGAFSEMALNDKAMTDVEEFFRQFKLRRQRRNGLNELVRLSEEMELYGESVNDSWDEK